MNASTWVLPVMVMPTREGGAHVVMGVLPDGMLTVGSGATWASACDDLKGRLRGSDVWCDESLTTVARRHGWRVGTAGAPELLLRATFALSMVQQWPPAWSDAIEAFVLAWAAFYPLHLWEQMPGEMSLPLLRRVGTRVTAHSTAVLGSGGQEFGASFYESRDDFDAIWSGKKPTARMVSAMAVDSGDTLLRLAFDPFGVPAPMLVSSKGLKAFVPGLDELRTMTATMRLLVGVLNGELSVEEAPGAWLEFEREGARARAKKARPARPSAKKRVKK